MRVLYKKVKLNFWAELVDLLDEKIVKLEGIEKKYGENFVSFFHEFIDKRNVKDLIESFGVPHTEVDVILIDGRPVRFSYIIEDKNMVEIFPKLSENFWQKYSSDKELKLIHLKPKLPLHKKFVCDVHLGKLVKKLRMLGLDVYYKNDLSDEQIINVSKSEKRIILTRDLGLLKRSDVKNGYFVRNVEVNEQVKEVLHKFHLSSEIKFFTRCLECGDKIKKVSKNFVKDKINLRTFRYFDEFYYCSNCEKVFWCGSHYRAMKNFLNNTIGDFKHYFKV